MSDPIIDRTMAVRIATQLGWEPKREWVNLTGEEFAEILFHGGGIHRPEIMLLKVQEKLKEKNT